MRRIGTVRRWKARLTAGLAALALVCLAAPLSRGQVSSYGDKQMGEVSDHPPAILDKVTITQKLNTRIPLDGEFRDETGKTVRLGDYFGKRPVIMSLVYYQCKILCPEEIDGLVSALDDGEVQAGQGFRCGLRQHRPERDAGDSGEGKGAVPEALRASGDGRRMAFSDRAASQRSTNWRRR